MTFSVHFVIASLTALSFVLGDLETSEPSVEVPPSPSLGLGKVALELPSQREPSGVLVLRPGQEFSAVLRHETPFPGEVALSIEALPIAGPAVGREPRVLEPASPYLVRGAATITYRGPVEDVLPLPEGTWQLTFRLGEPSTCRPPALSGCREKYAWVRIEGRR